MKLKKIFSAKITPEITLAVAFAKTCFLLVSVLHFSCELPMHPDRPENSNSKLVLRSSSNEINSVFIEDSINEKISIGCVISFPDHIDSINIKIFNQASTTQPEKTYTLKKDAFFADTLWNDLSFTNPGMYKIYSTTYITGFSDRCDTATITIHDKNATKRNTSLKIEGTTTVYSGNTCLINVLVDSTDSVSILKKPTLATFEEQIISWTTPVDTTGVDTLIIAASNKSMIHLSDTDTVILYYTLAPPDAPPHFHLTSDSKGMVTLHWDSVPYAVHYFIYRSDSSGKTFANIRSLKDTSFRDSIGAHKHYYYLMVSTPYGISPPTDTLFSSDTINRPPVWKKKLFSDNLTIGNPYTLNLSGLCDDPEGDSLFFIIMNSSLKSDTIINGVYKTTPVASDSGQSSIVIIVSDPLSQQDSLALLLSITKKKTSDSSAIDTTKQDTVQISINPIGTITAGNSVTVTGKISLGNTISHISYSIATASGNTISPSNISCKGPIVNNVNKFEFKDSTAIKISSSRTAKPDNYKLTIAVSVAGVTVISNESFTIKSPPVDTLKIKSATLGFQKNLAGSSLDVDLVKVYKQDDTSDKSSIQASVDLYFSFGSNGKPVMAAPSVAKGLAPFNQLWSIKNATKIMKVSASFEKTNTKGAIAALWKESAADSSVSIAANDVFVIKTVSGSYHLIKIKAASNSASGSATVLGRTN